MYICNLNLNKPMHNNFNTSAVGSSTVIECDEVLYMHVDLQLKFHIVCLRPVEFFFKI
jgi:hypothetical protein